MKKLSMIAATFAVMFAMVACSSPADKAVSFCEDLKAAVEANDMEKAMKIAEEVMEWEKGQLSFIVPMTELPKSPNAYAMI